MNKIDYFGEIMSIITLVILSMFFATCAYTDIRADRRKQESFDNCKAIGFPSDCYNTKIMVD